MLLNQQNRPTLLIVWPPLDVDNDAIKQNIMSNAEEKTMKDSTIKEMNTEELENVAGGWDVSGLLQKCVNIYVDGKNWAKEHLGGGSDGAIEKYQEWIFDEVSEIKV